jgi:integrase/recombinase XerC
MDYAIDLIKGNISNQDNELIFNNQLIYNFIEYTDVQDTTIKNYITDLKPFFSYLRDNNIKQPTNKDIRNYKKYLMTLNLTAGTKQQYFRATKHLFKWLGSEGIYKNVADNIKGIKVDTSKTKKESFNESDIKTILNKIDTNTEIGKRDYAIILLILTGGLRINEVRNIDIQDIQIIKNEYVVYILGKGHTEKDTYIKIIEPVYQAIRDYLDTKGKVNRTDALFTSTSNRALGKRITKESLSQILKNRFRDAGYDTPKLTAHSLRHTSNTMLYKSGADLYKVQQHARHKDPKTTEIYIHQAERETSTNELDIYNQIFNTDNQDIINDLRQEINNLNNNELKDVLNYIKNHKKMEGYNE